MNHAISIDRLTKRYGRRVAVEGVSYTVPEGAVCGLLGQNGAGKTTTIRCMLDLLRPSSGRIEVFGLDSAADSVKIRSRVGYLPEEPTYYPWMTVDEILGFNRGFFLGWDEDLAASLVRRLSLPSERRLRDLSRGMQAKVGLVMALAQRPDLLLLDDPTSGLDPIVRREFLEAMIESLQAEGGTVFFSTHLLDEMERVADEVAIMHEGRLLLRASLEHLKASRRRVHAVFRGAAPPRVQLPGLRIESVAAHQAVFVAHDFEPALVGALSERGFENVEVTDMDLEDIFVDVIRRADGEPPAEPRTRLELAQPAA